MPYYRVTYLNGSDPDVGYFSHLGEKGGVIYITHEDETMLVVPLTSLLKVETDTNPF